MNKTNIEWCNYTWNPVTGCKRGCTYCYARGIHNRFNKTPFNRISWHPERLKDPAKIKKPSVIFVGSMSDPEYWQDWMISEILDVCKSCKHHTFMFLSKSPFHYKSWPHLGNIRLGLTFEKCDNDIQHEKLMFHARENYRNLKFVSIEPLIGRFNYLIPEPIGQVIVGAMTGRKPVRPTSEMIQSVIENAGKNRIFWKDNIRVLFPDLCVNTEVKE